MSEKNLKSIKVQLEAGTLVLDSTTVGAVLSDRLQQAFSGQLVQLASIQILSETADFLQVRAIAPSLQGVSLQPVELVFFESKDQLECLFQAVLPEVWDFSWSFPDLPDYTDFARLEAGNQSSFFYDLRFPKDKPMQLIFSSFDFQRDQGPKSYLIQLDSTLEAGRLHQGLNFVSEIDIGKSLLGTGAFFNQLMDFAGVKTPYLPFYGYLNLQEDYEEIRLEVSVPFTKTFADVFTVGISSLVLHTATSLYNSYTGSGISFLGGVSAGSDSDTPSHTPNSMELLWLVGSTQLIIQNARPISFPGLETFSALLRGHLPGDHNNFPIESTDTHFWSSLEIRELSLRLDLADVSISHIVLGIGPSQDWQADLLGSVLSIEDLLLRWEVNPGAADPVHFYVLSAFQAGGGLVNVSAAFPDFAFYGELGLHQTIRLDQIVKEIVPQVPMPSLSVLDLAVSASIKEKLYAFEIDIASDWELPIGGASVLPLKHVHLALEKNEGGTFTTIDSVMTIEYLLEDSKDLADDADLYAVDLMLLATNAGESDLGWIFEGNTRLNNNIPIGGLIKHFSGLFGWTNDNFPAVLESLVFRNLAASFHTHLRDFTFSGEAEFVLNTITTNLTVNILISHKQNDLFEKSFSGKLVLGTSNPKTFDLIFNKDETKTLMLAAYHSVDGDSVSLADLIDKVIGINIPDVLTFTLQDAVVAYDKTDSKFLFATHMGNGIDLSKLPLIGDVVSKGTSLSLNYQIVAASTDFDVSAVSAINVMLPDSIGSLGDHPIPKGLGLSATMNIAGELSPLDLPIAVNENPTVPNTETPTPSTPHPVPHPVKATSQEDSIKWFTLQKKVGPVHFNRIGVGYSDGELQFALDASLSSSSLTISLDGLSVASPLTKFQPTFDLKGLGIDFNNEALEVGGAFLREHVPVEGGEGYDEFDGLAILKTEKLALSAIGSYAYVNDAPSLFIYAAQNEPLGGPSFFFVTGLSVGFGYNRALRMPTIDRVLEFPLVAEALNGKSLPGDANKATLAAELEAIHSYIPPATGQMFLAAGVCFTSFKLVNSTMLLAATFGRRFELDLLGVSTLLVPPEAEKTPLALVQMTLKGAFIPDEGFIGLQGQLTNASYVLSKDCHLSGGFATYNWFSGEHAGDFVTTLGGYHPHFQKPAHYPDVPRLAFNWHLDSHTTIKGDLYFALCAHALMAGGHLEAVYENGALKAWYKIGADFMVAWQPYHYEASLYIDIGASYTYHFFGTHHITVDIGADVHLWGPDFGGHAKIHIWIVTIGIDFGDQSSRTPKPITWEQFQGFLPEQNRISVTVTQGLVGKGEDEDHLGVINPKAFAIATDTMIPATDVSWGSETLTKDWTTDLGIGPMGIDVFDCRQSFRVERFIDDNRAESNKDDKEDVWEDYTANLGYRIRKNKAPSALWGKKLIPDTNDPRFIEDAFAGLEIIPGESTPGQSETIDRNFIRYETSQVTDAIAWEERRPYAGADLSEADAIQAINDSILDNPGRESLLALLGITAPVDLTNTIADDYILAPQVELR